MINKLTQEKMTVVQHSGIQLHHRSTANLPRGQVAGCEWGQGLQGGAVPGQGVGGDCGRVWVGEDRGQMM